MPTAQAEFDDIIRKLGRVLAKAAREHMGRQKWDAAELDVRISQNGGNMGSKYRIKAATELIASLNTPIEVYRLIDRLWELRPSVLANNWHGFVCTVTCDDRCEMTFNLDPNCNSDPSFYGN